VPSGRIVAFGIFEFDLETGELQSRGHNVRLQEQPRQVLRMLVARPGELITREALKKGVWPDETFVDFEAGLNVVVNKLRHVLRDSAASPRFIETVPRRGYRFIAPLTALPPVDAAAEHPDAAAHLQPHRGDRFIGPLETELDNGSTVVEPLPVPHSGASRRFSFRRRWVWFAAAAVLVAAGLIAVRSRWALPDAAPARAVPLTSLQGAVRSPSLSPDGTYVVFSWNGPKGDNPDLYVQQIGVTAPPYRLTHDPANDYSPSWSPDGRTIAFLRRGRAGGKNEVWRIAPLGGPERKVAETQPRLPDFLPATLAWCPDSTCLLVTDSLGADKPDALFRISVDTGERRQLTHPQGRVRDAGPAVSPDGSLLVFRRDANPGSGEFYRLSLKDGKDSQGDPVRLTSTTLWPSKPVWIPDSREILFSTRGGLFRLDALTGGTPSRLPFIDQDGPAGGSTWASPVVSRVPGGRRLVYVRSLEDRNVWRVDMARPGTPATSLPAAAIASTRLDMGPNLTPDGRRLVFVSDRSGEPELWVSDPDGSNAFQLTSLNIAPGFPRWSPDQTMIAFHSVAGVLVVPARGGQPRNITKGTAGGAFPSFSRDGHWIYFSKMEGGVGRIRKMVATGGAPVQVTNGWMPIESYDGDLFTSTI
jgi:Tol biopolymer transport system component/DNA-binding winged helix-turn-helix (wHTH) protein